MLVPGLGFSGGGGGKAIRDVCGSPTLKSAHNIKSISLHASFYISVNLQITI